MIERRLLTFAGNNGLDLTIEAVEMKCLPSAQVDNGIFSGS